MKRLNITILLTMLMSMVRVTAFAHDFEVKNADGVTIYYVKTSNNEVSVSCKGSSPSDYPNEYSGTVVIPSSVTYNGKSYTVTLIDRGAFYNCSNLTSITIPNSVTGVEYGAFSGCSGLTSIVISNSVTGFAHNAFSGCNGLTSIKVREGNPVYDSRGNCNAIIEKSTLKLILGCKNTIIPNDVKCIGKGAFGDCSDLTSIVIPNSVTSIDDGAFGDCSNLTSITIPNSVTSIGRGAFDGTAWYDNQPNGLVYAGKFAYKYKGTMPANTKIRIKDGTLGIGYGAFMFCNSLISIVIPNSVTSIGEAAFMECSSLTSIVIPNSVKSIGSSAFCGCVALKSIVIPNSVTSIGGGAFKVCEGLTSVTIPNSVMSIDDEMFELCSSLTSVTIPNSVMSIGNEAFQDCSSLTLVTIPNSVTKIGNNAFYGCSSLTSITIPNSVTNIGGNAFYKCSSLTSVTVDRKTPISISSIFSNAINATLYVPVGSKAAYMSARFWKQFKSIVEKR